MATDLKVSIPFHKRVFLYAIILFGVYMLCFIAFQYQREKAYKINMLNYRLQVINTRVGESLSYNKNNLRAELREIYSQEPKELRITVIDGNGVVLFDSQNRDGRYTFNNHADRPEVIQAMATGMGYTVRRLSESTNQEYFYSATLTDGKIIRSALPYSMSLSEVLSADSKFLWFMSSIAIIISLFGFMITRRLGANIEKLRKFVYTTSRGESVDNIGEFQNDELGEISSQVVRLYSELKKTKERLEGEHELIMQHEQEKAKLKKQLTQNINHELKTPVSSIKGYLEIMIDNPELEPHKRMDFINKSHVQVERLTKLLFDISTITRMDEASEMITKTELDLSSIINDVITEALPKIEQTGVIMSNKFDNPLNMMGNQTMLHSIFANLIDNALSYSGCSRIEIKITDSGESYRVCLSDNGIGIPREHLDRIFERFYRVDKGRSRKMGGTGLGLSIVKNAVMIHSGNIVAQERIGGGTEFIFSLRKV